MNIYKKALKLLLQTALTLPVSQRCPAHRPFPLPRHLLATEEVRENFPTFPDTFSFYSDFTLHRKYSLSSSRRCRPPRLLEPPEVSLPLASRCFTATQSQSQRVILAQWKSLQCLEFWFECGIWKNYTVCRHRGGSVYTAMGAPGFLHLMNLITCSQFGTVGPVHLERGWRANASLAEFQHVAAGLLVKQGQGWMEALQVELHKRLKKCCLTVKMVLIVPWEKQQTKQNRAQYYDMSWKLSQKWCVTYSRESITKFRDKYVVLWTFHVIIWWHLVESSCVQIHNML